MVDILGGMSGEGAASSFINFKASEMEWQIKGDKVAFDYMQLDHTTLQSGWGVYDGSFDYVWDKTFGMPDKQPEGYMRAFSCWVWVDGFNQPLMWQSYKRGESMALNNMLAEFWNEKDASEDLPVFKFGRNDPAKPDAELDAVKIKLGMGSTAEIKFAYQGMKPRKDGFVIPSWVEEEEPVREKPEQTNLTDDEIPF